MRAKNWQKPLPWLVVAALLVLWEVCVRAFDVPLYVLPGPIDVIEALFADVGTLFPTRWSRSRRRRWAWSSPSPSAFCSAW